MRHVRPGRLAVLAAILALATAACSPVSPDAPSNPSEGDTGQPAGALNVGVHNIPPGLGNPFTGIGSPGVFTWSAIFDTLTQVDQEGAVQPRLAESWENTEPTRWEFTLREDVTFSNDEPFDAEAVKATVDYLLTEEGKTTAVGGELDVLAGAEVVDPTTVAITTTGPDPILPAKLTAMFIVAPGAWAELGPDGFGAAPVGTGSFQVESIDANRVDMVAFVDSWRPPQVETLELINLGEPAARVQALQSGQVDLAINLTPDQLPLVEQAGATAQTSPAPQVMSLAYFQTAEGPVTDVRVRQALNYAVDKAAMAESLLGGLAAPASQGVTPGTFGYNPDLEPYPYDPDTARELLAEAGFGDGLQLTADVVVGTYAADAEIYQAMAADLGEVGVDVELRQIPFSEWLELYLQNGWTSDAFGLSWNSAPVADAIRPYTIFSCAKSPAFFCDEDVMPLIEQANNEFDPEARETILQELAAQVHENPPALLLVEQVDVNATAEGVQGYAAENRVIHYERMTTQ